VAEQTRLLGEEARMKVAVMEALAARIEERLGKLGASEERELRAAFAMMPERVYETTLERLESMGRIRRSRSRRDGLVFVAKADATRQELAAAASLYRRVEADSKETFDSRRDRYWDRHRRCPMYLRGEAEPTVYAGRHPLTDDRTAAEHDEDLLAGTLSEDPGFGIQGTGTTHEDAWIPTREEAEGRQVLAIPSRPMDPAKQRLVETQIRTGQGHRNANRAFRRWLAKPENQLERRCREEARRILAGEQARFHGAEAAEAQHH
jgi:DNA-binding MarR family transcriptional regulator